MNRFEETCRSFYERLKDMDDSELISQWQEYESRIGSSGDEWIGALVCEDILQARGNDYLNYFKD